MNKEIVHHVAAMAANKAACDIEAITGDIVSEQIREQIQEKFEETLKEFLLAKTEG